MSFCRYIMIWVFLGTSLTPVLAQDTAFTLRFAATVADETASCGETYTNVGGDEATITFNDFRLYVANIEFGRADGSWVPLILEQDGMWQYQNVALLDFENGSDNCSEIGNTALNGIVVGTAPADEYIAVRFDLGVPYDYNHLDVTTAVPPLNIAALWWNWQGGYKFIRIDVETDATQDNAWNIHIGSAGCESPAGVIPPTEPCTRPNVATITLPQFDIQRDVVVVDLAGLLTDISLYESVPMPPGCMSGIDDPDCPALFSNLGLSLESGTCLDGNCSEQKLFRVDSAENVTLIGRSE